MPLQPEEQIVLYKSIGKETWDGGETRNYIFIDNGQDFNHPEYGLSYVYHVMRQDKGHDPNEDRSMYVKPNGALAIALGKHLTKKNPSLAGRSFKFHKVTGQELKDTRYEVTENYKE